MQGRIQTFYKGEARTKKDPKVFKKLGDGEWGIKWGIKQKMTLKMCHKTN